MKKLFCAILLGFLGCCLGYGQTVALPAATPTQVAVPYTVGTLPSGDTGGTSLFVCTGTPTSCTDSSTNWTQLQATTALLTASGTFDYTNVTAGTEYCFAAVEYFEASGASAFSNDAPSTIECATVPLAASPATVGALSATS